MIRLVAAYHEIAAAPPHLRAEVARGLDELTRRRLALVLLDVDFLAAVAAAAVEARGIE